MRELTTEELSEASGGAVPILVNMAMGASMAAGSYWGNSVMTGTPFTATGMASAALGGAVAGGYMRLGNGLVGVAYRVHQVHSTDIGTIAGAAVAGATREEEEDS